MTIRAKMLGITTALLLLAACGHKAEDNSSESAQLNEAANMVEDASPDSLTAPENMALDSESGNAMDGDVEAPPPAAATGNETKP
jgi:uncharacterized membrane-anchored protein